MREWRRFQPPREEEAVERGRVAVEEGATDASEGAICEGRVEKDELVLLLPLLTLRTRSSVATAADGTET